jgi:small-conductance mechanosensitive channel
MSWSNAITIAAACAGAAVLGWITGVFVGWLGRRRPFLLTVDRRCRWPWIATLTTSAALSVAPAADVHGNADAAMRHGLVLAVIGAVTWLLVRVAKSVEDVVLSRLPIDIEDNRRVRKVRTQVQVLGHVLVAVLVVLGLATALMTFARMRALGTSLLASAGVAGIVGGLAAQSVLGNVFAGLQLAFTDALRVDDVVVVDDEWGRVEELTLTYVVLHLWDERRLVLPTTYFTTQPFQNWTRTSARNLGAVYLYLDYRTRVDELRAEAERIVTNSPLWDRQAWTLQVTDATERTIQVRVLASATDAGKAFDLRCDIREKLIGWLRDHHPEALPVTRVSSSDPAVVDRAELYAGASR